MSAGKSVRNGSALLGLALAGLGVLLLVFNILSMGTGPLIVTFAGLGLFVVMVLLGKRSSWLAVPASVVTMLGLILIYTNLFGHFVIWWYAWTLSFGAAGMGILISHYWSGRPQDTHFGIFLVRASLVAFVVLGLFFEVLIFSRRSFLGSLLWPAVLILLGGYLLLRERSGGARPVPKPRKVRSRPKKTTSKVEFEPLEAGGGKGAAPGTDD